MRPLLPYASRSLRVVDLGGSPHFWQIISRQFHKNWTITTVNLTRQAEADFKICNQIVGDATRFTDFSGYDLIFSNSMIEHVGGWAAKRRLAKNILASGKPYFVQTPNFWFPIEPHFLFPYFQILPNSFQTWLLCNFNIGWFKRMTYDEAKEVLDYTVLLNRRDMRELFPAARIISERVLGLPKSFVALDLADLEKSSA